MTAAIGSLIKVGIDTANPVTKRFDVQSESLGLKQEIKDMNGLRGTRSRDVSRVRANLRRVGGGLVLFPNAVELSNLLAWILGGSPTGSPTVTYPLADTLSGRYVAIDRNDGSLYTYTGCKVDKATFEGSQGEPLKLTLDVVGQDETISGSFPAINIDTANAPFIFSDLVLVVNSTTVTARQCTITIDNKIDKERFFNSLTLTTVETIDRMVNFEATIPAGDWRSTLYGAGAGGVAVTATFTNGGAVLAMSMAATVYPKESPATPGHEEVMMKIAGQAFKTGATLELVTTLNPGP